MSKDLTPLDAWKEVKDEMLEWTEGYEENFSIIESALKRLEEIDNKPVAFMVSSRGMENAIIKEISKHKEIKITNLADQKKLRALEIIKEKQVEVCYFMNCETLEEYNDDVIAAYAYEEDTAKPRMLTQKEYDLLREVLKNE